MRHRSWSCLAALVLGVVLGVEAASAQHVDVLVARRAANPLQLVTGAFDFSSSDVLVDVRVFGRDLSGSFSATDPGFNAIETGLPAGWTTLPASIPIGFNFVVPPRLGRNLSYWNGAGAVAFGPPPAGVVLSLQRQVSPGVVLSATANGAASEVAGFEIATTTATGAMHRHLSVFVSGNGSFPAQGIYLASLEVTSPGLTDAPPVIWLYRTTSASNASLSTAVAWADDYLVPDCSDGLDNDGDGKVDHPLDAHCTSPGDLSEGFDCDDGLDNDGDGHVDYPGDVGCADASAPTEGPACNDGIDNDADGLIDLADPTCQGKAWSNAEAPKACGLGGGDLLAVLPLLLWWRGRRRGGCGRGHGTEGAGSSRPARRAAAGAQSGRSVSASS